MKKMVCGGRQPWSIVLKVEDLSHRPRKPRIPTASVVASAGPGRQVMDKLS
jgi:hypothetical protein